MPPGTAGRSTTAAGPVLAPYFDGRAPRPAEYARCDAGMLQDAIRASVDQLDQPLRDFRCARGYAVAILELGQCPQAEATAADRRPACSNLKRSFWKSVDGAWQLLTFVDAEPRRCEPTVAAVEQEFPRRLCRI